jgi:hypothetical protein
MYQSARGARFAGLLNDSGQIIVLSIDGKTVVDYQKYYESELIENRLIAGLSVLVGLLCAYECYDWFRQKV